MGFCLIGFALTLMLPACTNLADALCRPAGQCPDAPDGINRNH
jgi:hypothetical protein